MADKENQFANVLYVGETRENFLPGKLPLNSDVLKVFFHHYLDMRMKIRKSSSVTADLVLSHWSKMTSCPCILKKHAITKIEALFYEWKNIKKCSKRTSITQKQREQNFGEKLEHLFDIRKSDCTSSTLSYSKKISNEKLTPSKSSPLANSAPCEKIMVRAAKCQAMLQTKQHVESQKADDLDMDIHPSATDSDEDFVCEEAPKNKKIRREIVTPSLTQTFDSLGVSVRGAQCIVKNFIENTGEDLADFKLSQSTIQKKRLKNRLEMVEEMKTSFVPDRRLCLHWDGKIVRDLSGSTSVDRIAIVVTGVTTDKILEIPPLSSGTAEKTADLIYNVVMKWGITDKVKALSFDTTAVNSGQKNGVCIRLQKLFGREMLQLACRHHILEIYLEALWVCHLGPSTGPDILLFKRFQERWPDMDQSNISTGVKSDLVVRTIGEDFDKIISFAKQYIQKKQPRADYLEMLNLSIIFCGGVPQTGIKFQTPGPISRARWMAKAIYSLKVWMFREQFKLTAREEKGLLFICLFVVSTYMRHWYEATSAIAAPKNDLDLFKDLTAWRSTDEIGSQAVLKKFIRHNWYLRENVVALALFDNRVPFSTKAKAVEMMQQSPRPIHSTALPSTNLEDLFSVRSFDFFRILNLPTGFLSEEPCQWEENSEYLEAKEVVENLAVVNDVAERAIQLMQKTNRTMTRKEDEFQRILQIRSIKK